ncbi:hypothetical protein [Modestobacter muralis]|uniref:hypothetical protein n=1 Tax=Modestobacter muralis TaxID=1608614 RepID=UPI001FE82FE4|nr:hypothetical protein [Modestobacter muralis]
MAAHDDRSSDPTQSLGSTAAGAHAATGGASALTNRIVAPDRDATNAIPLEREPAAADPDATNAIPVDRAATNAPTVDRESTNAIPVDRDGTNAIPVDRTAGADHGARADRTDALPAADRGAEATRAISSRPAAGLTTDTARQPATDPTPTAGHSTLPAMAAPAAAVPAATAIGTPDGEDTGRHRHPEPDETPVAPPASRKQVVAAQKERFGGISWGAAFFGWLSANGMAVLLIALLSAAGLAFGLSDTVASVDQAAESATSGIGLGAGIALLVALFLAYLAGGYVAGRMARFDGARQGVAVWVIGLVVVVLLALAGLVFGAQYNVLAQFDLPRIPIDEGTATTAGIIALVAVLLVTLIGAVLGGLLGTRYHRKVDRVGYDS